MALHTTGNTYIDLFILLFLYVIPLVFLSLIITVILDKLGLSRNREIVASRTNYYGIQILNFLVYIFLIMVIYKLIQYVQGDVSMTEFIDYALFDVLGNLIMFLLIRSIIIVVAGTDGHTYGVPLEYRRD